MPPRKKLVVPATPISRAHSIRDQLNAALKSSKGGDVIRMGSDPGFEVSFTPTGILPIDIALGGGLPRGRFVECYGDACVTPDQLVLTAAMEWKPAGDLVVGEELVGFDETLNQGRGTNARLQRSTVTGNKRIKLPCYRITTDKGVLTGAATHPLVARHRSQNHRMWRNIEDLQVGDSLLWFGSPWQQDTSYAAAWLAGFLDGEGYVDGKRVAVRQAVGRTADLMVKRFAEVGTQVVIDPAKKVQRRTLDGADCQDQVDVRVLGGMYGNMKFLGTVRPERLITNMRWEGNGLASRGPWAVPGSAETFVEKIEFLGVKTVVALGTTSKTYIAEGFPSHNSTLKSYIGYRGIAAIQQRGGVAALLDTEHAYDPEWAEACGIDTGDLIVEQPETGELAFDIAEGLIRAKVDLVVFDSVAATLPQAHRDKRLAGENMKIAAQASLMSAGLRKILAPNIHTCVYFCNQMRTNVGITFGNPDVPSGGRSLPFYASIRLEIKKMTKLTRDVQIWNGEKLAPGKEQIGQQYKVSVVKSKLNVPHRELRFDWSLADGSVDEVAFFVAQGVELGLIQISGSMWKVKGSAKTIRGRDAFARYVHDNPRSLDHLRHQVLVHHGVEVPKSVAATPARTTRRPVPVGLSRRG